MPTVTALINTYNHERFIEEALVSVLKQDFPPSDLEIIVVDDGSTDRTPEIIRKFGSRVRLIRKENGGQVSTFNVGVAAAQGEIVAFLDGDDWWTTNKLTAVARAFEANPGVAAVGHGYFEIHESAPPQEILAPEKTCILDLSNVDAARLADAGNIFLATSRLSVRRRVLERIGPLPPQAVFFDAVVCTLSFALGGALLLDEPLCCWRHHTQSLHHPPTPDENTHRRRLEALGFRMNYLPRRLTEFGVPQHIVDALLQFRRVEYERSKLQFGKGSGRWNVFCTELKRFRTVYKRPSIGYVLFQCGVGACALALSPRQFYRLLDWYSRNNVKRFRAILGEPKPRVPESFTRLRAVVSVEDLSSANRKSDDSLEHLNYGK